MYRISRREQYGPATFLWDVEAPDVAHAARAGHFVMARIDELGERIPLTVADYDRARGTVTVVVQAVGKTTRRDDGTPRRRLRPGLYWTPGSTERIQPIEGTVVLVGGGLGRGACLSPAPRLQTGRQSHRLDYRLPNPRPDFLGRGIPALQRPPAGHHRRWLLWTQGLRHRCPARRHGYGDSGRPPRGRHRSHSR